MAPDRTAEIWRRLVGLFGGDSVRRKYGDTPPDEWAAMIPRMSDYDLERGLRRLVHSGRGHVPSLPEFVRLCKAVGQHDDMPDAPRALALPPPVEADDVWLIAANRHLLGYVLNHTARRTRRFAPDWSCGTPIHPGPKAIARTAILVRWARQWADQMRAAATPQGVDVADQKDVWANCMRRAESEIDALELQVAA